MRRDTHPPSECYLGGAPIDCAQGRLSGPR